MAKNLERIGDHATNIAETIHYEITGDEMIGERPRWSGTGDPRTFVPRDALRLTSSPETGEYATCSLMSW